MNREFIYTQTRLQSRHGMRPDEHTWELVESQKELANYLQNARQSKLGPWVAGIQSTDNHHLIESTLLNHYRDYIEEVAGWVPVKWRKPVRWIECLTYLPAIQHLITGNTAYSWMLEDSKIKLATTSDKDQRLGYFLQSEFSPLFQYWIPGIPLVDAWLAHWLYLWPEKKPRQQYSLMAFLKLINHHRDSFSQLDVERTWRARQSLALKASVMFRRYANYPVDVFVHLLLIALDLERIRAAVMQRSLFANYQEKSA